MYPRNIKPIENLSLRKFNLEIHVDNGKINLGMTKFNIKVHGHQKNKPEK